MNVNGAIVNTTGVSASINTAAITINQRCARATPIMASIELSNTIPGTRALTVIARSFDSPTILTVWLRPIDILPEKLPLVLVLGSQRTDGSRISKTVRVIDQTAIAAVGAETMTAKIKIAETRRTSYPLPEFSSPYSRFTPNAYTFDAQVVTNTRPFATPSPLKCANSGIVFPLL